MRWSPTEHRYAGASRIKGHWHGVDRDQPGPFREKVTADWGMIGLLVGYCTLLSVGLFLAF